MDREGLGSHEEHRACGKGPGCTPCPHTHWPLGWALPLGTPTLPPQHQHGGPYKIRAHGASLAFRAGDKCGLFRV